MSGVAVSGVAVSVGPLRERAAANGQVQTPLAPLAARLRPCLTEKQRVPRKMQTLGTTLTFFLFFLSFLVLIVE